jgi:hypothetical protein
LAPFLTAIDTQKKGKLTAWFKKHAPNTPVGVIPAPIVVALVTRSGGETPPCATNAPVRGHGARIVYAILTLL